MPTPPANTRSSDGGKSPSQSYRDLALGIVQQYVETLPQSDDKRPVIKKLLLVYHPDKALIPATEQAHSDITRYLNDQLAKANVSVGEASVAGEAVAGSAAGREAAVRPEPPPPQHKPNCKPKPKPKTRVRVADSLGQGEAEQTHNQEQKKLKKQRY